MSNMRPVVVKKPDSLQIGLISHFGVSVDSCLEHAEMIDKIRNDEIKLLQKTPKLTALLDNGIEPQLSTLFAIVHNIDENNTVNKTRFQKLLSRGAKIKNDRLTTFISQLTYSCKEAIDDTKKDFIESDPSVISALAKKIDLVLPILQLSHYATLRWTRSCVVNQADEDSYRHNIEIIISALKILLSNQNQTTQVDTLALLVKKENEFVTKMQTESQEKQPTSKSWKQLATILEAIVENKKTYIANQPKPILFSADATTYLKSGLFQSDNGITEDYTTYGSINLSPISR